MKMKPMGDKILLKTQEGQETTKGGIILTSNQNNYSYADVVAVGNGLFTQTGNRIPMSTTVGDVVLIHSRLTRGDNEIELEDDKYILVRESEVEMVSTDKV
jgi:chaperonin GroES